MDLADNDFGALADDYLPSELKVLAASFHALPYDFDKSHSCTKVDRDVIYDLWDNLFELSNFRLSAMPAGPERSHHRTEWCLVDELARLAMVCDRCKMPWPCTTDFYAADMGEYTSAAAWVSAHTETHWPGMPSFLNDAVTSPCALCREAELLENMTPETYFDELAKPYPEECTGPQLLEAWVKTPRTDITKLPKHLFVLERDHILRPGIHHGTEVGKCYRLDCILFPQAGRHIPDLEAAVTELVEMSIRYNNLPGPYAALAQGMANFKALLDSKEKDEYIQAMADSCNASDKARWPGAGNFRPLTKEHILAAIAEHGGVDAITGMPNTFNEGKWSDVAMDRLDNDLAYSVRGNLQPVSLLTQVPDKKHHWTPRMFRHFVLARQTGTKIPERASERLKFQHINLPGGECPYCKLDSLL